MSNYSKALRKLASVANNPEGGDLTQAEAKLLLEGIKFLASGNTTLQLLRDEEWERRDQERDARWRQEMELRAAERAAIGNNLSGQTSDEIEIEGNEDDE